MNKQLKEKLLLPDQPGCYLMKDRQNSHLRGESESLEKQGAILFHRFSRRKTQRLVTEIEDFEYIVTSSNLEALILEMNLIKNTIRNTMSC